MEGRRALRGRDEKGWQLWSKEVGPEEKDQQEVSWEENRSQKHIDTKGTGISQSWGSLFRPGKRLDLISLHQLSSSPDYQGHSHP